MVIVEYSSNNSGGGWWLSDDDWRNLEAAGWTVRWVKDDPFYARFGYTGDRWLGALAKNAHKAFPSLEDGIAEWEKVVGQSADETGCSCCGQPHYFYDYTEERWEEYHAE